MIWVKYSADNRKENFIMKAIVTVIGKDQVGIIAAVCTMLSEKNVNVMDISQTIMQEYFTMIMLVDASSATVPFAQLKEELAAAGEARNLDIRIQREDIFNAMHRI
jgi:ACT domain-containing protein